MVDLRHLSPEVCEGMRISHLCCYATGQYQGQIVAVKTAEVTVPRVRAKSHLTEVKIATTLKHPHLVRSLFVNPSLALKIQTQTGRVCLAMMRDSTVTGQLAPRKYVSSHKTAR